MYFIYFSLVWDKIYPPHLRKTKHLEWGKVLIKPLQWLRDLVFETYKEGFIGNEWNVSTAYSVGDRVYYIDRGVYEALSSTTGDLPTDTTFWKKILDCRIGVAERIKYNSQKILFEFALNRWFNVDTTIDPPIYISNNTFSTSFLLGGQTGTTSSTMVLNSSFANNYLGNSFAYSSYQFTIYVPIAVFTALASNNTDRENVIRSFANKYVLAGMNYNVLTY